VVHCAVGLLLSFGYDPCCTFMVLDKAHVMETMSRAVEADDL